MEQLLLKRLSNVKDFCPEIFSGYFSAWISRRWDDMTTGRIKGITVEIGGDIAKLQTALKGVNRGIIVKKLYISDI